MMKMRLLNGLAIVSLVAALSGCVNLGNTHALVTPVGAIGYHTFKPDNAPNPNIPRDIRLQGPDRVAATDEQKQQADKPRDGT